MKKSIIVLAAALLVRAGISAQTNTYFTRMGHISFFSKMPMENIEAHNRQVSCMLDIATGDIAYKVLIKSFEFEKALMQEHFNENYMHSEKFPKASFEGKILNFKSVNFAKDGMYEVEVEGTMEIHGVKKTIKEKGTLSVKGGKIGTKAVFNIALKDYNIKNDKLENISENIQVTVDVVMEPYQR